MADKQRVFIVSNRLPVSLKRAGDNWQKSEDYWGSSSPQVTMRPTKNSLRKSLRVRGQWCYNILQHTATYAGSI